MTFAEQPDATPDYIFPLMPAQYANTANIGFFQFLLFRPLYWFGRHGVPEVLNDAESLAKPPVYSDHDRTVTITLKKERWSDEAPISARDVQFWINLVKAERSNWFAYVPGEFPDNITSTTVRGTRTIVLHLNASYSPSWFTHNQLSQITPLPQQAWDKESANGPIGNWDDTPEGARAVYEFLASQAKSTTTYASNPLWKVVDGPFVLTGYTETGRATFRPNRSYSGPDPARIAELVEEPFTSDSAEYLALRSNQLTYGYVPPEDVGQSLPGYHVVPWYGWQIAFMFLNFHNPTVGPILSQLYVRQALQHLIDQRGYIRTIYHGDAVPDYGPVPVVPKSSLASSYERSDPYPYSVAAAIDLLRSHGWSIHPGGVDTCLRPGTAADDCGKGIRAGATLSFPFIYPAGVLAQQQVATVFRSAAAKAGVAFEIRPDTNVLATAAPCGPSQPICSWGIADFGSTSWFYGNDNYPTGGQLFATGASFNFGSYSSAPLDQLISATHTEAGTGALMAYENMVAKDLPVLWQPVGPLQISAISDRLHGATPQSTILNLNPEKWFLTAGS